MKISGKGEKYQGKLQREEVTCDKKYLLFHYFSLCSLNAKK